MSQSFNILGTAIATVVVGLTLPLVFAVASTEHLVTSAARKRAVNNK